MRWLPMCVLLAACLESSVVVCEDGRRCPAGTLCEPSTELCVLPSQLDDCRDQTDGTACEVAGVAAECQHGLCLLEVCGDGIRSGTEECDALDLDGMSCDDAGFYEDNALSCDSRCNLVTTACAGTCGDAVTNGPELCDGLPPATGSCLEYGFDAGGLGCTQQCVTAIDGCSQLGWQPAGHAEPRALSTAGTLLVGVGDQGQIVRWDGAAWMAMVSPVAADLEDVWATSETDAWAVGRSATILHFDGASWASVAPPMETTADLRGVWASSTSAYAVGEGGTVLHWNGSTWTRVVYANPGTAVASTDWDDVFGFANGHVFVVGDNHALRYDGATWSVETFSSPTPDLEAIWGAAHDDVWVTGIDNNGECTLRHWSGTQWTRHPCPFIGVNSSSRGGRAIDLWGTAADDIWGVRVSNPLMRFNGTLWETFATPEGNGHAIGGRFGELFFVAIDGVYRWPYRGWNDRGSVNINVRTIAGRSRTDIFAIGESIASHWNGARWNENNIPARGSRSVVTSTGAIFAATANARVWHHRGGDPTIWGSSEPCTSCTLTELAALGDRIAVIASGTLYLTDAADGSTWSTPPTPGTGRPRHIWGASVDDHVIATDTAVYRVTPNGPTDLAHPDPDSIEALAGIGTLLIAAGNRRVHRHDGVGWTDITPTHVTFPLAPTFRVYAPDDIFVVGTDLLGAGALLHWNGIAWNPVRIDLDPRGGLWAPDGQTLYVAAGRIEILDRTVPWSCRATETACSDRTDDDCDGLRDTADSDCL